MTAEIQETKLSRFLKADPQWLISVGTGDGREVHALREKFPNINCLGIEPNPQLYQELVSWFPGELLNCAAGNRHSHKDLLIPQDPLQSTFHGNSYGKDSVCVEVLTLDKIQREYGPWDKCILWVDTEGHDLQVLQGAPLLLRSKSILAINVECRRDPICLDKSVHHEVATFLAAFGYAEMLQYNFHWGEDPHFDSVFVPVSRL